MLILAQEQLPPPGGASPEKLLKRYYCLEFRVGLGSRVMENGKLSGSRCDYVGVI